MVNTDKEIWKEISINTNYLVSSTGIIKAKERLVPSKNGFRHKKEHILAQQDRHGYLTVSFLVNGKLKNSLVHRLVMYAFKEERPYPEWEIDHLDGNKHNNNISNLEYVSSSENTKRAYNKGLQNKEVLSLSKKNRKMTPEQILEMKHTFNREGRVWGPTHNNTDFLNRYAEKYGMTKDGVQNILTGRTNSFIGEDIVQTTKSNYHYLNIEDIPQQGTMSNRNYFKLIANMLGVGWKGIETQVYHYHRTVPEVVQYYNEKYL